MWTWINAAVGFVAAHPGCALLVTFLAAIIEAVAVIGIIIPGTPILMATAGAAAMAGHAMLPFLAVAVAGAVIGDFVSFGIGCRHRTRLLGLWPFARYPGLLAGAERFFGRYGPASVALCRFVPVLRSTVPLIAGMAGMRTRRFVAANVLSAFVWAPVHIYPARFAGLSLQRLRDGDWRMACFWGLALLGCAAVGWCLHRAVIRPRRPGC